MVRHSEVPMKKFTKIIICGIALALTFSLFSCDLSRLMELLKQKEQTITVENSATLVFTNVFTNPHPYVITVSKSSSASADQDVSFSVKEYWVAPTGTVEFKVDWTYEKTVQQDINNVNYDDFREAIVVRISLSTETGNSVGHWTVTMNNGERYQRTYFAVSNSLR